MNTLPNTPLTLAIARYPHTEAVIDGRIPVAGFAASFLHVVPQIAAYRAMVRDLAYDVCELAPTTYLIARAHGAPLIALPVFLMRRFHHGGLRVRPDAGIRKPKDLEGKRVGVRAWSVTTGVWTRAIFASEYGLDCARVTWVVDDEEHVEALRLPANVEHAPPGRSLFAMMSDGDLAAGFDGNAGIGRSGDPQSGWKTEDCSHWPDLFPDAAQCEAEHYARTGIYPIHGTLVVKEETLKAKPHLAEALCEAFDTAKREWLAGSADGFRDGKYQDLAAFVGPDPLPFGIEPNRASIDALIEAAYAQGLIAHRMRIADAFVGP